MLLGVILLTGSAEAAESCSVNVRVANISVAAPGVLFQAKSTAAAVFARIGVSLAWHGDKARTAAVACWPPIEIQLDTGAPGADQSESLAYSKPYLKGGTQIRVFVGQVEAVASPDRIGTLLGHVLAHEITHVLEGVNRHSGQGLMKAHWDTADFHAMRANPLPFDDADVILIYAAAKPSAGTTRTAMAADE